MTPDELKAHRRAICDALIEGKEIQFRRISTEQWNPINNNGVIWVYDWLRGSELYEFRIKPQPRQCWVGWANDGVWVRDTETRKQQISKAYPDIKWQLVTENIE